MAGPVAHIVLALKIACLLPATIDKKTFIVGTSFPDIRYMANLSREETHIEPVSWHDIITEPSSFRAGMLFHNLVDILRIQYFESHFYDRYSLWQYKSIYIKLFPLLMKTAEDAFLYHATDLWPEIISYFDTIYEEEQILCPDKHIIKKWHTLLQNYFQQVPSLETLDRFVATNSNLNIYVDPEQFDTQKEFQALMQSPTFNKTLQAFYDGFEALILLDNQQHVLEKVSVQKHKFKIPAHMMNLAFYS